MKKNENNKGTNQEVQESGQQQEKEYKQIIVVNDEIDLGLFFDNLEFISKNKIPVAISPNSDMLLESIFANIRQYNYFAQVTYDPNSMSHRIVKIMPQMIEMSEALKQAEEGKIEAFDGEKEEDKSDKELEDILNYPEDK